MTAYSVIKNIHISCAALSLMGFTLRGVWMLTGSPLLQQRLTRILPHIVDSLLLLSAITLACMVSQYPFYMSWLSAKVLGLCAYIILGTIALKRGRTLHIRAGAYVLAITTFLWILSVALTRNALGIFSLWI